MAAAMDGEDRRRELASQTPGLGPVLPLPQPPAGPGVGLSDVMLPVVGEGYETQAEMAPAVHKAYGPDRPGYAHPLVGGIGYQANVHQPALRHVMDLGADGLFIEDRSGAPVGDVVAVAAAPSRPGLLSRARAALGRLRRR
jgi:hypothetical protein